MGSAETGEYPSFGAIRVKMDDALSRLRGELRGIQEQDVQLFQQLTAIRQTIQLLARYRERLINRCSSEAEDPEVAMRRPLLVRVRSAPLERWGSDETESDYNEDDDPVVDSFQSNVSLQNYRINEEEAKALPPLPAMFRKLLSSSSIESQESTPSQDYLDEESSANKMSSTPEPSSNQSTCSGVYRSSIDVVYSPKTSQRSNLRFIRQNAMDGASEDFPKVVDTGDQTIVTLLVHV